MIGARAGRCTQDITPWDSRLCFSIARLYLPTAAVELPAAYRVLAPTSQASSLPGRFVSTDLGVDEPLAMEERFEDPTFLKFGLQVVDPVPPAAFIAIT